MTLQNFGKFPVDKKAIDIFDNMDIYEELEKFKAIFDFLQEISTTQSKIELSKQGIFGCYVLFELFSGKVAQLQEYQTILHDRSVKNP